jgi:hypothetical protein
VCLVHVATATCHDLTADFDRAADQDAVAANALAILRPANGTSAGGTLIAALDDALAISGAALAYTHAAGTNSNIDALGRRSAGAESRQSGYSQNSKNLTHVASQRVAYSGVLTAKAGRCSVC